MKDQSATPANARPTELARLWRRVRRAIRHFPRLVRYPDYCRLYRMLPAVQRDLQKKREELARLNARYREERVRHRAKVADCESLKALLAPQVLAAWKRRKASERGESCRQDI